MVISLEIYVQNIKRIFFTRLLVWWQGKILQNTDFKRTWWISQFRDYRYTLTNTDKTTPYHSQPGPKIFFHTQTEPVLYSLQMNINIDNSTRHLEPITVRYIIWYNSLHARNILAVSRPYRTYINLSMRFKLHLHTFSRKDICIARMLCHSHEFVLQETQDYWIHHNIT